MRTKSLKFGNVNVQTTNTWYRTLFDFPCPNNFCCTSGGVHKIEGTANSRFLFMVRADKDERWQLSPMGACSMDCLETVIRARIRATSNKVEELMAFSILGEFKKKGTV